MMLISLLVVSILNQTESALFFFFAFLGFCLSELFSSSAASVKRLNIILL